MLQSAQGHQIIQTANGQQLVVQSIPAATGQPVQVASSADGSNLQHVQVLPVQNTAGAAGQPIMLQSQVIQTADGQTLIYQPVQMQDGTQAMVQQPAQIAQGQQVIQLASSSLATQQQAAITTTASAAATSSATASAQQQQQAGSGSNQNIIMMVPGATGGSPTIQRIPLPGKTKKVSTILQLYSSPILVCFRNA